MFGSNFKGDEVAKEFQKALTKYHKVIKKEAQVNPEDFLVAPSEAENQVDVELTDAIDSVDSHAKDQESLADDKCQTCHQEKCECKQNEAKDKKCSGCEKDECECTKESEAQDYYPTGMDAKAKHVLFELGKMAGRLRKSNKNFAADMVEATALSIQTDLVKEASKKKNVVNGLEKMAKDMQADGNFYAADILKATISTLKK